MLSSNIIHNLMFENYHFEYYQSIVSSKLMLVYYFDLPRIKKIVVFLIISLKYYKKNILLLYIIINLCFYCAIIIHNKEINNYQTVKFSLHHKKIYNFFNVFVNVYLVALDIDQNIIKKSIIINDNKTKFLTYRFNYFNFPIIPEIDFLYYTNESIFNLISAYQIRFNFYLKSNSFIRNSLEFLIRMFRFPVKTQLLK